MAVAAQRQPGDIAPGCRRRVEHLRQDGAVAAGGVALVLAATACSAGGGEPADPTEAGPQELVVSIWADYYPEDLAEQFEAATGIKLTIVNHTTNEDVVAKLTASADPGIDVAFMSGQYAQALAEQGRPDIMIVIGGVIPPDDVPTLREMGAAAVFLPGTVIAESALDLLARLREQLGHDG